MEHGLDGKTGQLRDLIEYAKIGHLCLIFASFHVDLENKHA
jgi:hypothetical protein